MRALLDTNKNALLKLSGLGLLFALLIAVLAAKPVTPPSPMQYQVVPVPTKILTPQGGLPANVDYTVSSAGAPFCIQGFRLDPSANMAVGPGQIGTMLVSLEYMDEYGVSHPTIKMIDGASGGFSPYDLVISYGSPICAAHSVTFHATLWPAQNDIGASASLFGQAIFLTAPDNQMTVQ